MVPTVDPRPGTVLRPMSGLPLVSMLAWASRIPYAIAAGIPGLVILALVEHTDSRSREPRWLLRRVTLLGALTVLPVLAIEVALALAGLPVRGHDAWSVALASVVVAALPEEVGKAACLAWIMARRVAFESRRDGVRYGARIGLGFALVENVLHGLMIGDARSFALLMAARAVLTVPMHAAWAALMGGYAARRQLDGRGPGLAFGLAVAVLGHGLFNFGLGIAQLADARADAPGFVASIGLTLAVAFASLLAVRRLVRSATLSDAEVEAEANVD